jgi:SPP1 gp7 family putative phage head morphogenesis protein
LNLWRAKNVPLTRQAAKQADRFADAFEASVDVELLVTSWFASYQAGDTATTQEARDWAKMNARLPLTELERVLRETYAIGAKLGNDVALAAIGRARRRLRKSPATDEAIREATTIDWKNWKPGNNPAAALLRPKQGLRNILDRTAKTARLLQDTTVSRIGTKLADALAKGLTVKQTAESLRAVLKDSQRAFVIAQTEMGRAMMAEQSDTYAENGVNEVEWLALDPCELCAANEADGAIPVGTEFSSGDLFPPAHPNCYCDLVPVIAGE